MSISRSDSAPSSEDKFKDSKDSFENPLLDLKKKIAIYFVSIKIYSYIHVRTKCKVKKTFQIENKTAIKMYSLLPHKL